jgi:hypothetical protein
VLVDRDVGTNFSAASYTSFIDVPHRLKIDWRIGREQLRSPKRLFHFPSSFGVTLADILKLCIGQPAQFLSGSTAVSPFPKNFSEGDRTASSPTKDQS